MSKKTKKRKLKARRNKANHGKRAARRSADAHSSRVSVSSAAVSARASGRPSASAARGASSHRTPRRPSAIVVRVSSLAPQLVGAEERAVDAAEVGVLARGHRGRTAPADLGASERRFVAVDRFDDVEQRDLGRRAAEPVAAARALHGLEHAGARERTAGASRDTRQARRGTRRAWRRAARGRAAPRRGSCTRARPIRPRRTSAYRGYSISVILPAVTMSAAMATVDEVELLPDAEQHKLLGATLSA